MPDPAGYEFIRSLGVGSMGPVYLARQVAHNREVAVKRILGAWNGDAEELARFHREAEVLGRVNHPNIVGLEEVSVEGSDLFVVTDYVRGASLRQLMGRATLTRGQVLDILADVARALTYAAGRSIVHGDLKPGNVFVTRSGVGKVGEFGLVKMISGSDSLVSREGAILGTPAYMSPEHAAGRSDIGPRADIYSMAVMAYELLVGRLPFPSVPGNVRATLDAHISTAVPRPSMIVPGFPSPVEQVLLSALSKEPSRRPETADEFWKRLSSAADSGWPGWASDDTFAPAADAPATPPGSAAEALVDRSATVAATNPESQPSVDTLSEPPPVTPPPQLPLPFAAPALEPSLQAAPSPPQAPPPPPPAAAQPRPAPPPPPAVPSIVEGPGQGDADEAQAGGERNRWSLALALLALVIAAAGIVAIFPLHVFGNTTRLRVLSISAEVTPTSGHCPSARYVFTATVRSNGQGGPVTYEWAKPDQRVTDIRSAKIPDGQSQSTATLEFTFQGQGSTSGDAVLHIITPNDVRSAPAHIVYQCP